MQLRRPQPLVLIVPPGLLVEFFSLARFAAKNGDPVMAGKILGALRQLRPDIPEFSAFFAFSLREQGNLFAAIDVLEEYVENQFESSSLVWAGLAKLWFDRGDIRWSMASKNAMLAAMSDGGGTIQVELLKDLPGFESMGDEELK
jgi:hypothetical protein